MQQIEIQHCRNGLPSDNQPSIAEESAISRCFYHENLDLVQGISHPAMFDDTGGDILLDPGVSDLGPLRHRLQGKPWAARLGRWGLSSPRGVSMDWFKGKNAGNQFYHQVEGFLVNFPLNQSIEGVQSNSSSIRWGYQS